ncbi:hypothetical protein OIU91_42655 (plasmid) [Streptomyces sp. NBC_01456]|uniref:hypothetical protein n=1 Tax=unclassified Streptomyces TaxID=2593676 RepID=UPI002E311661|nr:MULTISPECIES: hypothetical protein [unclassified Streptomyces]
MALILTGCGATDLDHGKVVEKRARAATGPIYENVERPAACRSARTQTLRTSLSRPNPPKPRPRTDTSNDQPDAQKPPRTDTSKPKSNPPRSDASKQKPTHSAPSPSTPGKSNPSAPCGTTSVPVFKGYRTPAKWELKLQDGNETDWETVTRDEYDSVEVGDHF